MDPLTDLRLHRTHATRFRSVLVALVVLTLVSAAGCAKKNPDVGPDEISRYVSLGDSYTAVSGAGAVTSPGCLRSEDDYPALIAAKLSIADFENAACAGATSENLTQTQRPQNGRGTNPPQLDSVTKDTDLVTLGIGLNDSGLSYYLLYTCLPVNGRTSPACASYLSLPTSWIDNAVRAMGSQVAANLKDVRKRAPDARIVLVGYPRLLPDTGACPEQIPLPEQALDRIRKVLVDVNETLERAAKRNRVDYVNMYAASEGHDVCSEEPWVNGQANLPGKAFAFHPYTEYHEAVAAKLEYLLEKK